MKELLIILCLIFLNGLFSLAEIALISSRKSRLESNLARGNKNARKVIKLIENPTGFLSAVQIGMTLTAILTGIFSGKSFAEELGLYFDKIAFINPYGQTFALFIVVIIVTYLTLVFGELVPKRIGLANPENTSMAIINPFILFIKVISPVTWILKKSTEGILHLLKVRTKPEELVIEEEIKTLIEEGASTGVLHEIEQDIVERVLHLGDRKIGSLLIHNHDVVWLDANETNEHNRNKIMNSLHTAYPLCDGVYEKILGVVFIKEMLLNVLESKELNLRNIAKTSAFYPENMSSVKVLEKMRETKENLGFVIDEYGSVMGIVTLNTILNTLIGVEDTDYPLIVKREENSWFVDAQMPFEEFARYFEIYKAPELGGFYTVAGFIHHLMGKLPKLGDKVRWENFEIEIVDLDVRRIDKVIVTKLKK